MRSKAENSSNLESALLEDQPSTSNNDYGGETSQQGCDTAKSRYTAEAKKQIWLAGPLICVSILQYCLQVISIMFVGHLGELALSGASMASSFASVTGFNVLVCSCSFFLFLHVLSSFLYYGQVI